MQNISLPHDHGQNIEKLSERIPKVEEFHTVSDIFKQLCDGSRTGMCRMGLRLVDCLSND